MHTHTNTCTHTHTHTHICTQTQTHTHTHTHTNRYYTGSFLFTNKFYSNACKSDFQVKHLKYNKYICSGSPKLTLFNDCSWHHTLNIGNERFTIKSNNHYSLINYNVLIGITVQYKWQDWSSIEQLSISGPNHQNL